MRSVLTCGLVGLFVTAGPATRAQPGDKAENRPGIIVERYREILLDGAPPRPDAARGLAATLTADGRWPDIDYADETLSTWSTGQHLMRLKTLALAVMHPASESGHDPAVQDAAERALDHWLDKRYEHPANWWHNRIGTPRLMRDVLIVLDSRLSPERRKSGWQVVAQSGRVDMTGANLIWVADLAIARAAATGNEALLAQAAARAAAEIKISPGDGIKADFSFHQHGARLQTFHYGGSYAHDLSRMAWVLRGTRWALPEEKVRILADYIGEGMDWMRRGSHTVPGTLDRAATRVNALGGIRLTPHLKLLREVLPAQAERMSAIIEREAGNGPPPLGFRHFPHSDFTAYHREQFSFFLKTSSTRTLPSERINNENLKGQRLYCSDALFMRDGREYFNMMPVWDWFWLPGITLAPRLPAFERRAFVGGAGDGQSGLVAIDYRFGSALTARKAWFCHGDRAVGLIGDLRAADHPHGVYTALDQCRLDGPVTIGAGGRQTVVATGGTFGDVTWLHHRGVAYVLLAPATVDLKMGEVGGAWHDINRGRSEEQVTDNVFRPLLYHGLKPDGIACGYLLAPMATAQAAASLAKQPGLSVLANEEALQAVRFDDGLIMAAFYQAGALQEGARSLLKVSHPCLVLLRGNEMWAANPEQRAITIAVERIGRPAVQLLLPDNGATVKFGG